MKHFLYVLANENDDPQLIGYFSNRSEVFDIVKNNVADIHETVYKYALIQTVPEGLYPIPVCVAWFEYNTDKGEYIERTEVEPLLGKGNVYL